MIALKELQPFCELRNYDIVACVADVLVDGVHREAQHAVKKSKHWNFSSIQCPWVPLNPNEVLRRAPGVGPEAQRCHGER